MREHKKKWLFDKGKTSKSRKRYNSGGDFSEDRKSKEFQDLEYTPAKRNGMKVSSWNKRKHALNFRSLLRFLRGKIGKDWSLIYSEIKERIPNDIWETHNPVERYVHTKVKIESDGSIWDEKGSVSRTFKISDDGKIGKHGRYATYYVHPETGLLCRLEPSGSYGRIGKPKLDKKEGKKKYAEFKTSRNKSSAEYKERKRKINEEAGNVLKEKKKQNKNDIQKG